MSFIKLSLAQEQINTKTPKSDAVQLFKLTTATKMTAIKPELKVSDAYFNGPINIDICVCFLIVLSARIAIPTV